MSTPTEKQGMARWLALVALLAGASCGSAAKGPLVDTGLIPDTAARRNDLARGEQPIVADRRTAATCPEGASFDDALRKVGFAAMVNGKGPYKLFYDSGAPTSVLSSRITGKGEGESFDVQSVDLGSGVVLGPATVESTKQLPSYVDGLIGNDYFVNKVITVDYGRKRFWVDSSLDEASLAACAHVAGAPATVLCQREQGHLFVEGSVDGVRGQLIVDTGAGLGAIEQRVVDQGSGDNPAVEGLKLDALIGTYWSSYMMFKNMTVGALAVQRLIMYTLPDKSLPPSSAGPVLGTLPYGFMQHFMVTIDLNNQKLRMDAVSGHTLVDNLSVVGYGLSLSVNDTGPVTITRLVPQSPADKAGLKAGERVVAIGGKDPAAVPPDSRIALVLASKPGVTVKVVTKSDGGAETTTSLTSADLFGAVP